MFGFLKSKKSEVVEPIVYSGTIALAPYHESFGYFDETDIKSDSPAGLLDEMVVAARDMANRAREIAAETGNLHLLETNLFVNCNYYSTDWGREPHNIGSGSVVTINSLVSTVSHYRVMTLDYMFSSIAATDLVRAYRKGFLYKRLIIGAELASNYRMSFVPDTEAATKTSFLYNKDITEDILADDPDFSAVRFVEKYVPIYDAVKTAFKLSSKKPRGY